jgi:prepilin-type processing-associated H-X9-DG protein
MVQKLKCHNEWKAGRGGGIHGVQKVQALTLIELLVIIAIIGILIGLFLPRGSEPGPLYVRCISNLRQDGIALTSWKEDNNNLYPTQYFTNADGTMKFANAMNGYRYFLAISNYAPSPEYLVCPSDKRRVRMTNWAANFNGSNISYFLGLDASANSSNGILLGDRNITNGQPPSDGIWYVTANHVVGWTPERHRGFGIVAFTDGHVQRFDSTNFPSALARTGVTTNRLLMP